MDEVTAHRVLELATEMEEIGLRPAEVLAERLRLELLFMRGPAWPTWERALELLRENPSYLRNPDIAEYVAGWARLYRGRTLKWRYSDRDFEPLEKHDEAERELDRFLRALRHEPPDSPQAIRRRIEAAAELEAEIRERMADGLTRELATFDVATTFGFQSSEALRQEIKRCRRKDRANAETLATWEPVFRQQGGDN